MENLKTFDEYSDTNESVSKLAPWILSAALASSPAASQARGGGSHGGGSKG